MPGCAGWRAWGRAGWAGRAGGARWCRRVRGAGRGSPSLWKHFYNSRSHCRGESALICDKSPHPSGGRRHVDRANLRYPPSLKQVAVHRRLFFPPGAQGPPSPPLGTPGTLIAPLNLSLGGRRTLRVRSTMKASSLVLRHVARLSPPYRRLPVSHRRRRELLRRPPASPAHMSACCQPPMLACAPQTVLANKHVYDTALLYSPIARLLTSQSPIRQFG